VEQLRARIARAPFVKGRNVVLSLWLKKPVDVGEGVEVVTCSARPLGRRGNPGLRRHPYEVGGSFARRSTVRLDERALVQQSRVGRRASVGHEGRDERPPVSMLYKHDAAETCFSS